MEGEAAAAILQVVVQNLIDHSKKEISLIRGLDKDAEKLTGSLHTIQKLLNDAELQTIPSEAVKSWLKRLEDVAFDADDVLDELNYHLLSNKLMKPMKRKKVLLLSSCFFPSFNHIARQRKMALKIKEIYENLECINKEAAELGLVGRLITHLQPTVPAAAAAFETDSFNTDPIFVGRDDVVTEVVETLSTSMNMITGDVDHVLSIFPIVGMGGLGKTTLTRKVFNHERIRTQFGSRIWVHVSQTFDPNILFMKILKELTSQYSDGVESRQEILRKLREALTDKVYLLVLDDVWNQDLSKWEDFMNSLSGITCTKGNAIIVTTRNSEVASIVRPFHVHPQLKGLSDDDCWSIIKARTFGDEDVPSEFETIGRKIAERCQGLPLAANVVGGVLRVKSMEKWLSIEHEWLPDDDDGHNITKILRLSFDHLSSPSLKKCFAYCSIFPKGVKIHKQELVEFWMAEGFLQRDGSNDMESVGNMFFNTLLQSSLLQVARSDDYGNVRSCVMHDLVHNLASSVLSSSNNADGLIRIRYMSYEHDEDESIPIPKYLRTLFFQGKVSSTMFLDMECLHVLTLSCDVEEFPSSIRKLMHLRNLNISETNIKHLPEWIGELHHLQTLRAETGYLKKLPSTFKYLINLRHLYIEEDVELPEGIGRLTSLQTLTYFVVGNKNGSCKIEELGRLNNLKGRLDICNLEEVRDREEAEKANLFKKSKISVMSLKWSYGREGETNDENVMEGLQPHPNLNMLCIDGFKGKRFPLWTVKMAVENVAQGSWIGLNKLTELRLYDCVECEEIPMLGHLPSLKSLKLNNLSNLRSINSSFYGFEKEASNVFPALERLELEEMPKLTKWAEVEFATTAAGHEVKVFPLLQYLKIKECMELMSAPSHFSSCLKQLELTLIDSDMPLASICGFKLTSLTTLHLQSLDGLECLPDQLFYNNQDLSELTILNCNKLRELPDGLHTLSFLKKLIIEHCPNLKWIGGGHESEASLTSLHTVKIYQCLELMDFPCEMVVWSKLERLELYRLSSLKNLPSVMDCLANSPRLRELEIVGVPKFMHTSPVEIWHLPSLRKLKIDVSMEGSRETVNGILHGCCHSLDLLYLRGMQIWECLPESIQHLTASTSLKFDNFGMHELPEWLGNLTSLRKLRLSNCRKLRHLPSMEAMQRLTKLENITSIGCPELCIDEDDDGSEWSKISHIPNIYHD